jgi:hypothetical protein
METMSETTPGTWQPDPFGRFAQRYWDGASWTANVIDSAGAQSTDPPVPSAGAAYSPPRSSASALPVPGLVVVGVGALLVLLSDFGLAWFSGNRDVSFSDLREFASESSRVPFFVDQYLTWGWLLGLAAVAFAVVAMFVPTLRLPAAAAAAVMVVWHAWTVYDTGSNGFSPQIGAWMGAVGFAACVVGTLLPRPQATAA